MSNNIINEPLGSSGSSDNPSSDKKSNELNVNDEELGDGAHSPNCSTEYCCDHYSRGCKIVAPCCQEVFGCRLCHDSIKYEGVLDPKIAHTIDRYAIVEVECHRCGLRQAATNECTFCHLIFGKYHCEKCNFWDNQIEKKIFHCDECNMCRVGGRENFFHCQICGSCYSNINGFEGGHKCVEGAMRAACPVCLEDLFTSVQGVSVLRCGHNMHTSCLEAMCLSRTWASVRCPTCHKSINPGLLNLDREAANYIMPPELQYDVKILCSDCSTKSMVQFHVIGHKCPNCKSYNTRRY
eukprot:Platyproteum_vivax@DN2779_c0_g1_i1.p1